MLQFTRFTITDLSIWFRVNLFVAGRANMWLAGVLYSLQSYTNFLCDESVHSIGYKGLVKGWVSSTVTSVLSFGVLRSSTPQLCFSLKLLKMYVLSFFQLASVFSPPYYFYVTCWVCDHALWHFHWCWITHDDSFHTWHLIQFTFNSDQLVWSNITQRIDTAAGALVLGIGARHWLILKLFTQFWLFGYINICVFLDNYNCSAIFDAGAMVWELNQGFLLLKCIKDSFSLRIKTYWSSDPRGRCLEGAAVEIP